MAPAWAAQRMEIRRAVAADDHSLAINQARVRLKASGGFDNGRETVSPVIAVAGEAADELANPCAPSADSRRA